VSGSGLSLGQPGGGVSDTMTERDTQDLPSSGATEQPADGRDAGQETHKTMGTGWGEDGEGGNTGGGGEGDEKRMGRGEG